MSTMKQIVLVVAVAAFLAASGFASAHTAAGPMREQMERMMGQEALSAMEELEEAMMGLSDHERMEELMAKLFAGTISGGEMDTLAGMMQDARIGPGGATMMARGMMGQMAASGGLGGIGMMGPWGMAGYGWGGVAWAFWITTILVWILLALGIAALWRWLNRRP